MTIACLGWGSLIWEPKDLPVEPPWFEDGPILPIEFIRKSNDERITLVVDTDSDQPVRVLWALMFTESTDEAREFLRQREFPKSKKQDFDLSKKIPMVTKDEKVADGSIKGTVQNWLKEKDLDAVIWTGLSWNKTAFEGKRPNAKQVVDHLRKLEGAELCRAEQYVRNTPKQIDTSYRRTIEKELGWTSACNN